MALQDVLNEIPGVNGVGDDAPYGREQLVLDLTPTAEALGLSVDSVSRQLRAAYDGYKVQELSDGYDDIDVRLILPESERRSVAGLPDIDVDAQRIQQAISNLLTNAAKFTPPGGCVSLSVMRGSRAGDVMISVSDTGIGIEPSDQEWVFERLRQARTEDAARGVDGGGIGLGLAITKEIVQLHGGNISLESEPGFGTTFHILLPVAVATEASQTREMQTVRS